VAVPAGAAPRDPSQARPTLAGSAARQQRGVRLCVRFGRLRLKRRSAGASPEAAACRAAAARGTAELRPPCSSPSTGTHAVAGRAARTRVRAADARRAERPSAVGACAAEASQVLQRPPSGRSSRTRTPLLLLLLPTTPSAARWGAGVELLTLALQPLARERPSSAIIDSGPAPRCCLRTSLVEVR